jgi:hypothetical protein
MPVCGACKETKPDTEFWPRRKKGEVVGFQHRCKPCQRVHNTAWRKANPDKVKRADRKKTLWKRYGLTPENYDALFVAQNGRCAICRTEERVRQRANSPIQHLAVDHDARSGAVRGLLCFPCNRALGVVGDTLYGLQRFQRYLENPPAEDVLR